MSQPQTTKSVQALTERFLEFGTNIKNISRRWIFHWVDFMPLQLIVHKGPVHTFINPVELTMHPSFSASQSASANISHRALVFSQKQMQVLFQSFWIRQPRTFFPTSRCKSIFDQMCHAILWRALLMRQCLLRYTNRAPLSP